MLKRPLPKRVFAVDPTTLIYAPVENSIVYKLRHVIPCPPLKKTPYVPIINSSVETIVSWIQIRGASDEEIAELRQKNRYVLPPPKPTQKKTHKKKKVVVGEDLDKVFSQFATKTVVKKKVLKAVVKKT